jgi:hypothetical protein
MTHMFRTCWFIVSLILVLPLAAFVVMLRYRMGCYDCRD